MRVGVVTTSFPRYPGDPAGAFVAELCLWIQSQGHTVEVVAAGEEEEECLWQNIALTRVKAPKGLFYEGGAPDALRSRGQHLQALLFSARLLREVRKKAKHWEAVVTHWLAPSALASVLVAGKKPIWAIAHGGDVHLLARLGLSKLAARMLDRPNVQLSFVSQSLRDEFARHAGHLGRHLLARSKIHSMGIDLLHFQSLRVSSEGSKETRPLVLFLGRLVHIKGVDTLLEALEGLDRDCQVVIAGAGPQEGALKELSTTLQLSPTWVGEVRGAERDALLARAQVVVVPSREDRGRCEGMPLVAMEALASGAELIASQSGGLAEIPASICHHVAPDDPGALRDCLRQILDGKRASAPDSWVASRAWSSIAPVLLSGLNKTHNPLRTA